MRLSGNTVCITGGSSGVGLKLAEKLLARGNRVIVCGRTREKLDRARESMENLITFRCDISRSEEREKLADWINAEHPSCNVLVNNAAIVHKTNFINDQEIIPKAELEIQTNLMGPIALSKLFWPILERNSNPAIINVTTGLVYAPRAVYPVYNATKAALHSFTQTLRLQAEGTAIAVKEVLLPVVDTPWHKGDPPDIAISAEEAVDLMLAGLAKGKDEVRVGGVKKLYFLSRIAPSLALKVINRIE